MINKFRQKIILKWEAEQEQAGNAPKTAGCSVVALIRGRVSGSVGGTFTKLCIRNVIIIPSQRGFSPLAGIGKH